MSLIIEPPLSGSAAGPDLPLPPLDPVVRRPEPWLRPTGLRRGQPRVELTVWANEQLRRNVIPAEHRAALLGELKQWLGAGPYPQCGPE